MRIVLDTNVLVAGLLSPFGPCAEIVRMVSNGDLTLCCDSCILCEYNEVLRRPKFRFNPDTVTALMDYIEDSCEIVAASPLAGVLPDPGDRPFLEAAVASGASYLVAGNLAHFPAKTRHGVKVASPADFISFFRTGLA